MQRVQVPYVQFRTSSIIQYSQPDRPYYRDPEKKYPNPFKVLYSDSKPVEEKKQAYSGTVTKGAQKRIAKAVSVLMQTSPVQKFYSPISGKKISFKLGFLTLTISSVKKLLTAKEAHKLLLEPFLRILRNRYKLRSYIWKAELQKRGQIHYHLTINRWIHYKELQRIWNSLQQKAGLLNEYFSKKGHYNPNSIDIHSVKNVQNLEAYLVKYLSKNESDKGATTGKIWDCSMNLKQANYFTDMLDSGIAEQIEQYKKAGKVRIIQSDFCSIVIFRGVKPQNVLSNSGKKRYLEWVTTIQKE